MDDTVNGYRQFCPSAEFLCKYLSQNKLPRMNSNHDKVIQSHLVHDGCAIVATTHRIETD